MATGINQFNSMMATGINQLQGGVVFTNSQPIGLDKVEYLNTYIDENGVKRMVFEYQGQQFENIVMETPAFIPLQ